MTTRTGKYLTISFEETKCVLSMSEEQIALVKADFENPNDAWLRGEIY